MATGYPRPVGENKTHPPIKHPMKVVLLEGAQFYGLNVVQEIPEVDLGSPNLVELPAALVQKLEWARNSLAAAEADVLGWMRRNGKPELATEFMNGYSGKE